MQVRGQPNFLFEVDPQSIHKPVDRPTTVTACVSEAKLQLLYMYIFNAVNKASTRCAIYS